MLPVITGNWAMSVHKQLAAIPVLFLLKVSAGRRNAVTAPFSFNLKKTLYESSTVAQIAERFESNTVLWVFHTNDTIQPAIKWHFLLVCALSR